MLGHHVRFFFDLLPFTKSTDCVRPGLMYCLLGEDGGRLESSDAYCGWMSIWLKAGGSGEYCLEGVDPPTR